MLMKIGEVTGRFGISHRSLHYWESAGILRSSRGENDYRFYDEDNVRKIRQIVLLRKLRFSIPSIQEIFSSSEFSKVLSVFTNHLDRTEKELDQLNSLGIVLKQLLNMLKDRQEMDSVYSFLDTAHCTESEELKAALKTVFTDSEKEIRIENPSKPVVDVSALDLELREMTESDIPNAVEIVKLCYSNTEDIGELLDYYNFSKDLTMPGCRWWYRIMQQDTCIGMVNLAYSGMASMVIRNIAYLEPDNNIFIFELLKLKHPDVLCWLMFDSEEANEYSYPDREMKKTQFREDNGFKFLTNANRRNQYEYLVRPFEQIYNGSKYRFALGLDESSDLSNLSWLRCAMANADWYDNYMGGWRITDCFLGDALIYDTGMQRGRFFKNDMTNCDFRYNDLENSTFTDSSLKNCKLTNCDLTGMTINGINVVEALEYYSEKKNP